MPAKKTSSSKESTTTPKKAKSESSSPVENLETAAVDSASTDTSSTEVQPGSAAGAKPAKAEKAEKPAKPTPRQKDEPLSPFLTRQLDRLLRLKDSLLDSMSEVARDSLRSRAEGSEASAFGMHQADAGSDAYDRDFALSLLSQEQDALYEIEEALKRVEAGTYGICEMSGKPIPHPRLEALPFTRYTVECQAELEKRNHFRRVRQPVTSLFGLNEEDGDGEEDDTTTETKD